MLQKILYYSYKNNLGIMKMAKVKLEDVIEQLEFANESSKSFYNIINEEIYIIPEEVERYTIQNNLDDEFISEWEKELIPIAKDIQNNPENYISFPDQFEIHEYSIMERFCLSLNNDKLREIMYSSIKGRGAFQRFKDKIHEQGIAEDWYKYKEESLKEIAIGWCENNNIEYY
jgi:hypothetical protein